MKDVTKEFQDKILNDNEESSTRRSFTGSTGKEFNMPKDIFESMIKAQRYYEAEYVDGIIDNWKDVSKRKVPDFKLLSFFGEELKNQIKENPRLMNEIKEDNNDMEQSLDKIMRGNKRKDIMSLISGGKMTLPKSPTSSIYLTSVRLEKTESFKHGNLEGSYYDIIDKKGNKIEGVHFRDSLAENVFTNKKSNAQDVKEQLDMSRLDPRPMVVVCVPFDSTKPMLQIIRIQSGGKTIDPLIPTVPGM